MNLSLIFQSGDAVLISVFVILVLMSISTWTIIIIRVLKLMKAKSANAQTHGAVWSNKSWKDAEKMAGEASSPMGELLVDVVRANKLYHSGNSNDLTAHLPLNEFVMRQIHHKSGAIMRQFEGGMTALASIGATAPFIGLFGTVWGIYHALINISQSGQMSIAAVAGPIGEALVSTAFGLFVAIPAVLAYNFLVRSNKKLGQDMQSFAHELYVQILNNKE
ncbi:MAG: MotA/TolQ/ExbB proton channel family protein [Neisseria sp.]|uniref:MotA/TolQ/ExbB proton channel family protein n=1 Tax=Neisseria sp. TaxID=192066 RepID=UPI0026DC6FE9|nr:MotA/TolQ/ExbB proton channel family protein [Neisseria sp.]MDO4640678.1 MotA/TolQ/ExbB proton channel family protein [Neisseria sp.]